MKKLLLAALLLLLATPALAGERSDDWCGCSSFG
jgi:hypothetical protein